MAESDVHATDRRVTSWRCLGFVLAKAHATTQPQAGRGSFLSGSAHQISQTTSGAVLPRHLRGNLLTARILTRNRSDSTRVQNSEKHFGLVSNVDSKSKLKSTKPHLCVCVCRCGKELSVIGAFSETGPAIGCRLRIVNSPKCARANCKKPTMCTCLCKCVVAEKSCLLMVLSPKRDLTLYADYES